MSYCTQFLHITPPYARCFPMVYGVLDHGLRPRLVPELVPEAFFGALITKKVRTDNGSDLRFLWSQLSDSN